MFIAVFAVFGRAVGTRCNAGQYVTTFDTPGLAVTVLTGLHREPDTLRLLEQMIGSDIAIDSGDD